MSSHVGISILCGMRNEECGISTTYNLLNIRCGKKLAEFSIVCSVTKVEVCYLLNGYIYNNSYCKQITEHSAPVIPQSIRVRILHSTFRKVFSPSLFSFSSFSDWGVVPVCILSNFQVPLWPSAKHAGFGAGVHAFEYWLL